MLRRLGTATKSCVAILKKRLKCGVKRIRLYQLFLFVESFLRMSVVLRGQGKARQAVLAPGGVHIGTFGVTLRSTDIVYRL
jgi:hypothetical protein